MWAIIGLAITEYLSALRAVNVNTDIPARDRYNDKNGKGNVEIYIIYKNYKLLDNIKSNEFRFL